jgi:Tfp pilus assembly protein PilN
MTKPQQTGPIDLNILPEAYRPKAAKPIMVLLASVAGGLFFLAIICFVLLQVNRAQVGELRTSADRAQEKLRTMRTPAPEIAALAGQLASDQHALEVLQTLAPTVAAGQRDWEAIFGAILSYDVTTLRLLELLQDGNDLRLGGLALSRDEVLAYAGVLDRSGVFEQVIVQSLESSSESFQPVGIMPTDTPTGTVGAATPLPPGETPLPTGSPYDPYEIDDFDPQNIFVGEVQRHNFSPIYDADLVQFLGKAGRRYCVQALPQAAGVDTVLEVTVSGVTLTNDDCHPNEAALMLCRCPTDTITGSLASLVEVQVPSTGDQQVQVKVTNRGQYGPAQWYSLLVTEASGDLWESDDRLPKPIALGEVQRRTFYPEGDIDRVVFPVKAGYAYELSTSGLAVGVDTVVTVDVAGSTFQSDDVSAGNLASAVRFQAIVDGQASAVITNKGQYGTGMTYALELHQVGGDAYEPDDYVPRPLSPFEQQAHTFFPIGDIDRAEFNVKAGRIYEVRTYSLTVGVDTVLSVLVDGLRYQNDDVTPGDPTSRLVFQAQRDGVAGLTISNREQYGAYHSYYLTLTELAGTPTPNYALTPTPLPGATATPTATFTPDCRDDYEPDDAVGRQIVVGAPQVHNFCPLGDSDRVVFTAKAGYAYRVETTGLALGIDTTLAVQMGGTTLTNDDRSPQDLSSSLQVQNLLGFDAPAFVQIQNKGPLYGQDKTYTIAVSDLGAGDAFETDDIAGVPIAVGGSQQRTFFPDGDIDRVYFMAKAGHVYEVSTDELTGLVDTMIAVDMGAKHLANDDRYPGNLSSRVELFNDTGADARALVTVTNNGAYRTDGAYTLKVKDLGTDAGDIYEPDLVALRYIAVNESQRHTFHPSMDVDRVILQVKAGRRYVVYTCGDEGLASGGITGTGGIECAELIPGCDTVLTVAGPIENCFPTSCQNDDADPGSSHLNSRVVFSSMVDGEVTITIYNKGQFGPQYAYWMVVEEVGAMPPTPVAATPTVYLSRTPTATYTPAHPPTATVTATPAPYPPSTDSGGGARNVLAGDGRGVRVMLAAPMISKSLLQPELQQAGNSTIQFVLSLRMRRVTP